MLKPMVLVIGSARHADFGECLALLQSTAEVVLIDDVDRVLQNHEPGEFDWVVLTQSRKHELARNSVDRLRLHFANAKFVSLLGTWCEGELRTGQPWPDVARYYWYEFPLWWSRQCKGPQFPLKQSTPRGTVLVSSRDWETAQSVIDALACERFGAVWHPEENARPVVRGCTGGVWVGGQLSGLAAARLDEFCRRFRLPGTTVVALLDFPRRDEVQTAQRLGVARVLGKPWRLEDLVDALLAGQRDKDSLQAAAQASAPLASGLNGP